MLKVTSARRRFNASCLKLALQPQTVKYFFCQWKALAALVITVFSASPVCAQQVAPKIHKLCIEAKDYAGCVKAMTTPTAPAEEDSLTPLRNAMKQVAARLTTGTSLRDSTETFRPVVDQLAIVASSNPSALAVEKAKLALRMFDSLQEAWDARIKVKSYGLEQYGMQVYNCKVLQQTVDNFNSIPGAPSVYWSYKKGLFGIESCKVSSSELPEVYMMRNVVRVLEEGAISPAEIAQREKEVNERKAKVERERELCAMGPWNRYLEENPNIRKWVDTNPSAAEAAKKKFLANPKNQADCNTSGFKWSVQNLNYGEVFR